MMRQVLSGSCWLCSLLVLTWHHQHMPHTCGDDVGPRSTVHVSYNVARSFTSAGSRACGRLLQSCMKHVCALTAQRQVACSNPGWAFRIAFWVSKHSPGCIGCAFAYDRLRPMAASCMFCITTNACHCWQQTSQLMPAAMGWIQCTTSGS